MPALRKLLPILAFAAAASAQTLPAPRGAESWIADPQALLVLGKSLFWDMQLGSDNQTACATCHFHAGSDHRARNRMAGPLGSFSVNRQLTAADFPLTSPAIVGSAGVFSRTLAGSDTLTPFAAGGLSTRQVTGRKSPSVINAVFNARNFWDGRALTVFTTDQISVTNSSLVSQAQGPPVSDVEMAYHGRTWLQIGQRMLYLRPLAQQRVAADDSILSTYADPSGRGLAPGTYWELVQAAFQPQYWAEENFSTFFGLAIQAYETTLVSFDTPFDRGTLTAEQRQGQTVFNRVQCNRCHSGTEFTSASYAGLNQRGNNRGQGAPGFFRTGVRPAAEDLGLANGSFKTPGLRNVEFTGPYFHNGGQATLEQVVDFYDRGSDFPAGNLGPDIRRRNLSAADKQALVAFMLSLTDDRVKHQRAPFDHPELCIPVAHAELEGGQLEPDAQNPLSAKDRWAGIPAVGQSGGAPLQTFAELLAGIGGDGSRANHLNDACTVPGLQ